MNTKKINRTDIINLLINNYGFKNYLEIGVDHPSRNFDHVIIESKIGVDPNPKRDDILGLSSDDFFLSLNENQKYDLIFIDGLHHSDQVLRDIYNSLKHLSSGGMILCHDMLPDNEEMQEIPQKCHTWTGDCWKAWAFLRMNVTNLEMVVLDCDHGIGIITEGNQELFVPKVEIDNLNYNFFVENKQGLMNILNHELFV